MYYLIAHMIDRLPVGSAVQILPLHMTLVHWFYFKDSEDELVARCGETFRGNESFICRVDEEDMFGFNKDTTVNRVARRKALFNLHSQLINVLDVLGVQHTAPQWVKQGWNPHVTHQKNNRLHAGDKFTVNSVDLIVAPSVSAKRKILASFELSE